MKYSAICIKIALKLETHKDLLNSQSLDHLKMFKILPEEITDLERQVCLALDFKLGIVIYNTTHLFCLVILDG